MKKCRNLGSKLTRNILQCFLNHYWIAFLELKFFGHESIVKRNSSKEDKLEQLLILIQTNKTKFLPKFQISTKLDLKMSISTIQNLRIMSGRFQFSREENHHAANFSKISRMGLWIDPIWISST